MDCPNREENLRFCTCTCQCSKRGMCCQCIASHRRMGEIPGCLFPPDAERTYDRSVENFIRCQK
jgi:hypothetical protein